MQVVDLAVLDLEVAPERAAQPACLGSVLGLGAMEHLGEDAALRRGQRPLAHLGVRPGRDVDAADRRMLRKPGRRRRRRQPVGVGLERIEEPLDPATLAPAVLPGRRPAAELLAVVAHHPDPVAGVGGVVAQVVDDLTDLAERDAVAQALLRAEDPQQVALVLGRVRAPEVLLGDRRGAEVGVVEDRPVVARRRPATSAGPVPRPARPATPRAAVGPNSRSSSSPIRRNWPMRSRSGSDASTGSK